MSVIRSVKKDWKEVKGKVKLLNNEIYELIDFINPTLPIFEVNYPYGQTITDNNYYFCPKDGLITKHDVNKLPYFMSVDKNIEIFLQSENRIIPDAIYSKGDFFPKGSNLGQKEIKTRPESPFIWTSGIRNVLLTPINEDTAYYERYRKKYGIDDEFSPDNYTNHFEIIKSVLKKNNSNWKSTLYAFSHDWKDNIENNKKWIEFKLYLLRQEVELERFRSNLTFLDYALNEIATKNKINIKSYTMVLIREICLVALGGIPAYAPSIDDQGLASKEFIEDYLKSYSNRYAPIIYETRYIQKANNCVYIPLYVSNYFLVNRKKVSIILYLNELSEYIDLFFYGLSQHPLTKDSDFGKLNTNVEVNLYSSHGSGSNIKASEKLLNDDSRFKQINDEYLSSTEDGFNKRSIFNNALISIKRLMP